MPESGPGPIDEPTPAENSVQSHPFVLRPHRTLLALSIPVLFSLIAEPLTGLVDTAFVAQLGAIPLAAMGIGTVSLSSFFWIFNFLGIGTQTQISQALGQNDRQRATQILGLALILAAIIGICNVLLLYPLLGTIAHWMGASADIAAVAVEYMRYRLFGLPPMLMTMAAFGALRGTQDMRTPLWIAVALNVLNIFLDWLLIDGWGMVPAWGVAGAAIASTISHWFGALCSVGMALRNLGIAKQIRRHDVWSLFQIGRDLFVRTALLLAFLVYGTRLATQAGADAGAVHQALRQVFILTALILEAFATTSQSLVGYFIGGGQIEFARKVARVSALWSFCSGIVIAGLMWLLSGYVISLFIPVTAVGLFGTTWFVSLATQPISALAFIADGIHWGTGDFVFLRNVMLIATSVGIVCLVILSPMAPNMLLGIWLSMAAWLTVRAGLGILRIWPGLWGGPWQRQRNADSSFT